VHRLALCFKPAPSTGHHANYLFLVHHDGSVTNFRFLERSGDFAFDL
jgi:hypothetical protein